MVTGNVDKEPFIASINFCAFVDVYVIYSDHNLLTKHTKHNGEQPLFYFYVSRPPRTASYRQTFAIHFDMSFPVITMVVDFVQKEKYSVFPEIDYVHILKWIYQQ